MTMYTERPRKAWWVTVLLLVALAAMALSVHKTFESQAVPDAMRAGLGALMVLVAYLVLAFYLMQYRVTGSAVEIHYPPFVYRIQKTAITRVSSNQTPFWMGAGVRIWGQRIAFSTRYGRVVDIEKNSGFFKHVWLTPNDPDAFAKTVQAGILAAQNR